MPRQSACTCEKPQLVTAIDENLAPDYMSGNKYCRYCLGCGRRYFCGKQFFKNAIQKYVIPMGDSEPVEAFECPAEDCGQLVHGEPDACPHCGAAYDWSDDADADAESSDDTPAESTA